ncbi:tRNA lysidine(34) synthetase TilS [Oscillatoria sp. FACHB-1407]|uniref:tRNA lysidine(34) synthetase TilS n=1 Tax=Oscillatoria sp. FACHB-1407 TaxID=2692847 RepID=UPI00168363FB|nr:tRNA lysidine(34) synthetase TilS [Oscillatoria sp. FACHB-1407]MBD2462253.1 tRNA lysidine(34) synthetase TilS [Oscillatoria sp. FACHB-1407]
MWTPLHDRLHKTLRHRGLLSKQQRLLVAVSGGQDSLCLAQLLLDLQPKWRWELAIAHCNHQWRTDSAGNASYVMQLAQQWGLPGYCVTAETPPTSEAAARQWRYEVLASLAQTHGYTAIATGHTASDRAETLLYNLIRGSGADGLQALTWQRALVPGVQLVRPLLEATRAETAQFCHEAQLTIWEDSTNQDQSYARNRIRHDLLPYLQTHFNPQVEQALAQTAELLRAEVAFLETSAQHLREQANVYSVSPSTTEAQGLKRSVLRSAPLALQRRVMRQVLQELMPSAPSFEHIEKLTALITATNRSRTDPFPGGAIAEVEGDWIWIRKGREKKAE